MATIKRVYAREILDSRANPTIEATVVFENGVSGTAAVPSGASTGAHEAHELRDNEERCNGKGVLNAVDNVNGEINDALKDKNGLKQGLIDELLIAVDGTKNKNRLGANALLSVSLATAKAASNYLKIPLYRYIGGINGTVMPTPMMNILNGGAHASNNIDIQEFMIMPTGFENFDDAMFASVEVYHSLGDLLKSKGLSTTVGDEGGFAPNLNADDEAISLICDAIDKAGYKAGEDFFIALDAAATEWVIEGGYYLPKSQKKLTKDELIDYFEGLTLKYPIISIEDPLGEDDFVGFKEITKRLKGIQIVGDDLFVTNKERLKRGIKEESANAILVKLNQIGTLSETLETVRLAQKNNYNAIISHRSGETEDTTIADLSVALSTGQIKTGAPARTDRVCKYNRLLKINRQLGGTAEYLGNIRAVRLN